MNSFTESVDLVYSTIETLKANASKLKRHISLTKLKVNADLQVADAKVSAAYNEIVGKSAAKVIQLRDKALKLKTEADAKLARAKELDAEYVKANTAHNELIKSLKKEAENIPEVKVFRERELMLYHMIDEKDKLERLIGSLTVGLPTKNDKK